MITIQELDALLKEYGREKDIPVSFNPFKGRPDASTMIMWENTYDEDVYADDLNHFRVGHCEISLLQAERDLNVEKDFESMLTENRLTFALTQSEHYPDEDLWETLYEIEVKKENG